MLKNTKIGVKLIVIGAILLLLPVTTVGIIAVRKSREALVDLEMEQLEKRSLEISQSIYNVLDTERKIALEVAARATTRDALSNVMDAAGETEQYAALNLMLERMGEIPEWEKDYLSINVIDRTGVVKACSVSSKIGLDLSERSYVIDALAGKTVIGSPTPMNRLYLR